MIVSAASFARIVNNLSDLPIGDNDRIFGMGYAMVSAWRPRRDVLVIQALEFEGGWGDDDLRVLRTAGITVGGDRNFEVTGDGVVLGETRGIEAALSIALDYVIAPAHAFLQHELDPCGV
jgi:hypothetical protein